MARKIGSLFSVSCDGTIWQTALSESTGLILLQVRNEELHQTTFTVVNLISGESLIKERRFEESWWLGITAFVDNYAVLHVYEDEQNPQHKSLFVWDIESDQVVAEFKNTTLIESNERGMLIRNEESQKAFDWAGNTIQNWETEEGSGDTNKVHYPFHFQEEDEDFATIKSFIEQAVNVSPTSGADYLEYHDLVLLSYNIKEEQGLANYLLVSNTDGEVIFHQKINTSTSGTGRDTFFIFEQKLVYIKDYNTISVYEL